jgi:localization factor PodJL
LGAHFNELENVKQAAKFYKLAADQGNPFGIMGLAYNTDDDLESFQLFMKAAIFGDCDAQFRIGVEFLRGAAHIDLPKNLEEGFSWIEKSANNGQRNAQYYMG